MVASFALRALASLALALAAAPAMEPPAAPAISPTMKAIRFHTFGGPEVLVLEDVPRPTPSAGEMLVRVAAAAVNPVDCKIRSGKIRALASDLPRVPGFDLSGTVTAVGEGVKRFKPGDAVFAYLRLARGGAYAEYAIVREDEAAPRPKKGDDATAAAIPLAALTAWQALYDTAHLEAGQTVLIHGAAGGVGSFAVQLAKARGATVIGTASAANHDFLQELGADQAIDYKTVRFEEVVHGVDVVLDTVGSDTLERSFRVVKPGGVIVSIAGEPSKELAKEKRVRAVSILVKPDADELAQIGALVDQGAIRPVVSQVLPLRDARRAHEMSETGHTRGKIVLRVAG